MRLALMATVLFTLCISGPAFGATKKFRVSASGTFSRSIVSPEPPRDGSPCQGLEYTRSSQATFRFKPRKGSDTVTLNSRQSRISDRGTAKLTVAGTGSITETYSKSPAGCPQPNGQTVKQCAKTKPSSVTVTVEGRLVGVLVDPAKDIFGTPECPPAFVGFNPNTSRDAKLSYRKLKRLRKGKSLTLKINQNEPIESFGFSTGNTSLVLKIGLKRVK